jgi:dipeptidyl-peptidase-4
VIRFFVFFLALALVPMTSLDAATPELTIARLFADPPLSGPAPRLLRVAPDGARVTFLRGRPEDANRLDLWEYHIASGETRMLVDSSLLAPVDAELSEAEKARRERLRIANFGGIVDYQFAPDGRSILFPLNGALYLYDLTRSGVEAVRPLTRAEDGFATDPKVSPQGRYVSFVRDRTLYAIELASGRTLRLTPKGEGTISYAMAEFVAQEEMDRLTGYWWAPDEAHVAWTRIDEAPVPVARRFEIHADRVEMVEQRYPFAGRENVRIELYVGAVVDLDTPPSTSAHTLANGQTVRLHDAPLSSPYRKVDLGPDPDIYLPRVDWANAGTLTFQRQSRDQRRLYLLAYDLDDSRQRTLLTEQSETWVNLHDDLRFLEARGAFVWASERSGRKQLYLYGLDGRLIRQLSRTPWAIENVLAVDRRDGIVYVHAPGPDPLGKHVYAYRLDGRGQAQRITQEEGWHDAVFARDGRVFVATHSDPATPPRVRLHDTTGAVLAVLEANPLDPTHPYYPFAADHAEPEFGTLTAEDGQVLHYGIVKPRGFDPAKSYPAIVRYYGGPGRQFVRRDWTVGINTGLSDLLTQYWVRRGYVVFAIDNRGTPRRGKVFEDPLYRRMGELEVSDQRVGIEWLVSQPGVDGERVGTFGWSYGGYLALMLLAKAGDLVHAGAAVNPVTDWSLYDTHYTERYMDHPERNVEGYRAGNVLEVAGQIDGELLLIHGMADDNVLFTHSTALMAALQARAFPFEFMGYPGGKHALVGTPIRTHVYETIDRFFARTIGEGHKPAAAADE